MSHATRIVTALAVPALALAALPAAGQAVYYHHHSTAAGDYMGGWAEAAAAAGSMMLNQAQAERILVEAEILDQQRRYEWLSHKLHLDAQKQEAKERKALLRSLRSEAAERQEARHAVEPEAAPAATLLNWPKALRASQFQDSRSVVEGICRNCSTAEPKSTFYTAYRCALATEIGVLRAKVASRPETTVHDITEVATFLASVEADVAIQLMSSHSAQVRERDRPLEFVATLMAE